MSNSSVGCLGSNAPCYSLGISIGIVLLVTTIALTLYLCSRSRRVRTTVPRIRSRRRSISSPTTVLELLQQHSIGVDEDTIMNYPTLLYSEAKLQKPNSTATCCSICLQDYKGTDMLRILPDCAHLFHLNCIDPWLRLHPSCPVCRTSPLPTPPSTPLAELLPFGSRHQIS